MNKLWQIISAILGAISVFFYVSNKSKDRKIEKQKDEIKSKDQRIEEGKFINEKEKQAKQIKDGFASADDPTVNGVLDKQGALRD